MSGPGKSIPGFIASALHRSVDDTKVVVYNQWSGKAAGASLAKMEEMKPFMKQAFEISTMVPIVTRWWTHSLDRTSSNEGGKCLIFSMPRLHHSEGKQLMVKWT
jgi:hypothetical protein